MKSKTTAAIQGYDEDGSNEGDGVITDTICEGNKKYPNLNRLSRRIVRTVLMGQGSRMVGMGAYPIKDF